MPYLNCQVQWGRSLGALRPDVNISIAVGQESKNQFAPALLNALQLLSPEVYAFYQRMKRGIAAIIESVHVCRVIL